jgi:hypothetical protein
MGRNRVCVKISCRRVRSDAHLRQLVLGHQRPGRPHLDRRVVATERRDVEVPQLACSVLTGPQPRRFQGAHLGDTGALLDGQRLVPAHPTEANEQDVAFAAFGALRVERGDDLVHLDGSDSP